MKLSTKIWIVLFIVSMVGSTLTFSALIRGISIVNNTVVFNFSTLSYINLAFSVLNFIAGNILYLRFLKSRKFSSMIFFSTAPVMITFGALVFVLATINSYEDKTFKIVRTALNISTTNYNRYYWIIFVFVVVLLILFITYSIISKPIKKVEKATKRLAYGEIKNNIEIGGNKQFIEIENSLNKINDNYKKKDETIKKTNLEYEKIVPKQMLKFLDKKSVSELEVGSQVQKTATIMFCSIRNSGIINQSLSLEENFNYINSYLNIISPIIRKFGGFVDKYLDDGIMSVFVNSQSAISCAVQISKTIEQKNLIKNDAPSLDISISIHTGEVVFGVVGDEVRKAPTVISNSVNLTSKMDEVNKIYGTVMLVSKGTLNSLPSSYKFEYRYIGNLSLNDKVIPMFECTDVYSRQKRDSINKHHIEFENAVRLFINGKYEQAKGIFEKVYQKEKDDKVCYVYYNKCCENLGKRPLGLHE